MVGGAGSGVQAGGAGDSAARVASTGRPTTPSLLTTHVGLTGVGFGVPSVRMPSPVGLAFGFGLGFEYSEAKRPGSIGGGGRGSIRCGGSGSDWRGCGGAAPAA
eukprot:scaffold19349_cov42-Phaeocystis_antarctica.AAC.2